MTATKGRPAVWQAKKTLRRRVWEKRTAYIMIAPFTLIFLTFTLVPVVIAMFFSFTYYNILQPPQWVGWVNYVKLFFNDEIFLTAVKNTLIFAAVTGPVSYGLCFIVAWFVNELTPRVRALMTLLFYAPSLSGTVSIWMIVFSGDSYGYVNAIGMQLGLINTPKQWFSDPALMKTAIIVVVLWSSLGVRVPFLYSGFTECGPLPVRGSGDRWHQKPLSGIVVCHVALHEGAIALFRHHEHYLVLQHWGYRHPTVRVPQRQLCGAHDYEPSVGLRQYPL